MKTWVLTVTLATLLLTLNVGAAEKVSDIAPPSGFKRVANEANSYANYLRSLPLSTQSRVKLWNGSFLPHDYYQSLGIVDLPLLFDEDLEQCADFSMRLWSEYLKSIDSLKYLSLFDFYGRKKSFAKSGKSFQDYLYWHMKYSNSYSIKLGAERVSLLSELRAGDMFVQNDSEESIGHVSVVIDQATNNVGQSVYLVGYSFMPAQQFHIEEANEQYGPQGWFTADGYYRYAEDVFGSFGKPNLRRYQKVISD